MHASESTARGKVINMEATANNIAIEASAKVKEAITGRIGTTNVRMPHTALAAIVLVIIFPLLSSLAMDRNVFV